MVTYNIFIDKCGDHNERTQHIYRVNVVITTNGHITYLSSKCGDHNERTHIHIYRVNVVITTNGHI